MRFRILLLSIGITVICILLFSLASTQVYYQSSIDESKDFLRVYINLFDDGITLDKEGAETLSDRLNGARVTFMDSSGNVLADTRSDSAENHADRAEVQQAWQNGEGFSVRDSETLGESMVYYCKSFEGAYEGGVLLVRIALSVPSVWTMFVKTLPTVAAYIGIDIVLCVVLAFVATHFILSPVQTLAKEAVANDSVTSKYYELSPLAEILNERNRNISRQMREIREEKEAVERARSSKDEFISNVTHEMNTPLTSIRGYAELLGAGALNGEQEKTAYEVIMSQSERLTNLIACIINYSEIDNDDLPPYEVDFTALARENLRILQPEAEEKGVTLIDRIEDNVKIMSRHELVNEVLGNLLRNAIRYNKAGGTVTVTLNYEKLTVADTGVGIAPENMDKIFSRFFTVDKSHGGKNGGFGLGLAVVKKICRKSGWKISVESVLGEGSTFTVEF